MKTEQKIIVPDIVFPKFPELDYYEKLNGKIIFSDSYIIKLAEYKILIQETEKTYNEIKELYNDRKN